MPSITKQDLLAGIPWTIWVAVGVLAVGLFLVLAFLVLDWRLPNYRSGWFWRWGIRMGATSILTFAVMLGVGVLHIEHRTPGPKVLVAGVVEPDLPSVHKFKLWYVDKRIDKRLRWWCHTGCKVLLRGVGSCGRQCNRWFPRTRDLLLRKLRGGL